MISFTRLYARLVVVWRAKQKARAKEAYAQSCGRKLYRLAKLNLLSPDVAENLLTMDADQIIIEYAFASSPSEA